MDREDWVEQVMDRFETYHNELVRFPTIHGGDYFVAAAVLTATDVLFENLQHVLGSLHRLGEE